MFISKLYAKYQALMKHLDVCDKEAKQMRQQDRRNAAEYQKYLDESRLAHLSAQRKPKSNHLDSAKFG
ncbi:MAG: hypothetical protein ACPHV3_05095 [Vibrio sp.]